MAGDEVGCTRDHVLVEGTDPVITIIAVRDRVITIIVIAMIDVIATICLSALLDAANNLDSLFTVNKMPIHGKMKCLCEGGTDGAEPQRRGERFRRAEATAVASAFCPSVRSVYAISESTRSCPYLFTGGGPVSPGFRFRTIFPCSPPPL